MLSKNLDYRTGNSRLLACQLSDSLERELSMKLGFPVGDLQYLMADPLVETLTEPEEPWPAPA
jgi:hypothetical protein